MKKRQLRLINPARIRKIKGSFGWIDHRFINDDHIRRCEKNEILLYFFLIAVSNRDGLSFWGDYSVSSILKLKMEQLINARLGLIDKLLIAYKDGGYQVLALPEARTDGSMESIGDIFQGLLTTRRR
jgi:hypothetical protein